MSATGGNIANRNTHYYLDHVFGNSEFVKLGAVVIAQEKTKKEMEKTGGDTLVYLRDKRILFSGDVLFTNYHPFLAEGNIEEWVRQLDEIASMDVEKITAELKKSLPERRESEFLIGANVQMKYLKK